MFETDFASRQHFTDLKQLKFVVQLGSFRCDLLYWGCLGERWWRNYLHIHSFYEVCCAFDGEGLFRIHDEEITVRTGDVFVARPGEPHEIISSEATPLGIYFWAVTFSETQAEDVEIDGLLNAFVLATRAVSADTASMQHTLLLLTDEIVTRAPGYRRNLDGLIGKLILDTARAVTPVVSAAQLDLQADTLAAGLQVAHQIKRYLHDNYDRPLTIRNVAAQVHLSERHASRIFHTATGDTIMAHLQQLRINAASRQLIDTRHSIKSIGEAVGFPDVQHFTTVFKRRTGLTPAVFRRQNGTRFVDPTLPDPVHA